MRDQLFRLRATMRFMPADTGRWIDQQRALFRFWWHKPAVDITPASPPRKLFGTQLPSRNGAFRPTLQDVLTGKARRAYFN